MGMHHRRKVSQEVLDQGQDEIRRAHQRFEAERLQGEELAIEDTREGPRAEDVGAPETPESSRPGGSGTRQLQDRPRITPPRARKSTETSAPNTGNETRASRRKDDSRTSRSHERSAKEKGRSAERSTKEPEEKLEVGAEEDPKEAETPNPLPALKEAAETPMDEREEFQGTPTILETPYQQPPLFDEDQLRRFRELHAQAQWMYPGGPTGPPIAMQPLQPVQRPLFLEYEEQRKHEEMLRRSQYPYQQLQEKREREEAREMKRMVEKVMQENQQLTEKTGNGAGE